MATGLGTTSLRVVANTTIFEQTLRRSIGRMRKAALTIFAVGTAAAAGNFFGAAIKDSIDLERQVKRIKTLVDTPAEKGMFSPESVRALSNEIGISADKTAESLFYLLSSGIKAADAMDVLAQSSKTAVAQNADLKNVTDFASSALNAYGGQVDTLTGKVTNAEHANDILNKALDKGKGSMNDFSKYISSAIPIADSLGIGLGEIAAAGATSTLTGMSARKAFTGLKVAMQQLNNPTKGLGQAFEEITGKTFRNFIKEGGTLADGIKILGENIGSAAITSVEGAKEGQAALQQLFQLWPQYMDTLDATADAAGVTGAKFEEVDKSLSRQLERLKVRFENFRGAAGDWLGPVLNDALTKLASWGPEFKAVFQAALDGIQTVWTAVAPAFQGLFDFIGGIDWMGVANLIGTAFQTAAAMAAPFVWIIVQLAQALHPTMTNAINATIGFLQQWKGLIVILTAAIVTYTVATKVAAAATAAKAAVTKGIVAVTTLYRTQLALLRVQVLGYAIANGVAATSVGTLRKAQLLLNMAFRANPIGFVITVLALLGTAFYVAWTKSETFRKIVVAGLNGLKDVVVTVLQFIINKYLMFVDGIVSGAAKAFGWVPGIGGKLKKANEAFDKFATGVNNSLNAIKDKDIKLTINGEGGDAPLQGPGLWGRDKECLDQMRVDAASQIEMPEFNMNDLFLGGKYDPEAKKAAEKTAKEAAAALKAAMNRVKSDLSRIQKNIGKQSIDKIKENFKQLYADMKEAKAPKSVIEFAKKQEKALLKVAKARDKIAEALDKQKAKLKDLKAERKDYMQNVKDAFHDLADVTTTGYYTIEGLEWRLERVLEVQRKFNSQIKQLQATNIDRDVLRDIIDAGPVEGAAALEALLTGGQGGIDRINALYREMEDLAYDTAKTTGDGFYAAGIAAAEGLVKGLESQHAVLVKQMEKLADALVDTVKKKLKIKSPSQVFEDEVGKQIAAGTAKGVTANIGSVSSAAGALSSAATGGVNVANGGGAMDATVNIVANGPTLQDIVRVEIRQYNRSVKNRAVAGSTSGIIRR